tara:strand:- start:3492 stop:3809 length:318 start_codon:yes stop_codon:yes gene_type:complete
MRILTVVILSLFLQSCMISLKRSATTTNNPPPTAQTIEFSQVDIDKDGTISKEEVESYNHLENKRKSEPNISTPLMFLGAIIALIVLICGGHKAANFILGVFKNK